MQISVKRNRATLKIPEGEWAIPLACTYILEREYDLLLPMEDCGRPE